MRILEKKHQSRERLLPNFCYKEDELTSLERRNTQNQNVLESYTYTYDNNGNCTEQVKTSANPNETTSFAYYVGGNLKQVTLPDETEISFHNDVNEYI